MGVPASGSGEEHANAPIANFSDCHVGILEHLKIFGSLPALLAPAAQARKIAVQTLAVFYEVIAEHHAQEERDLFPAVLESATQHHEREQVRAIVERLTAEHRHVEALWSRLRPALIKVAKGHDVDLDEAAVAQLVSEYRAHAMYEEAAFLPLSQTILSRNANHLAALGLSLHMRHVRQLPTYL